MYKGRASPSPSVTCSFARTQIEKENEGDLTSDLTSESTSDLTSESIRALWRTCAHARKARMRTRARSLPPFLAFCPSLPLLPYLNFSSLAASLASCLPRPPHLCS